MRALIGFADPLRDGIREALETAREAGHPDDRRDRRSPADGGRDRRARPGSTAERVVVGEELAAWDDDAARAPSSPRTAASWPGRRRSRRSGSSGVAREPRPDGRGHRRRRQRRPGAHRADVAVAMGSGTAVAKEAADLVLGDDSFATLMYGLREGRRIVDNVQKGLVFLISTHVALLGFILIATLVRLRPAAAADPDPVAGAVHRHLDVGRVRAREGRSRTSCADRRGDAGVPLLTDGLLGRIAVAGGFSAIAALVDHADPRRARAEHARWLAYTSLVCAQAVRAYANRSLRDPDPPPADRTGSCWRRPSIVIAIQATIPFVPPLAEAFRATPLDASDWLIVRSSPRAGVVAGDRRGARTPESAAPSTRTPDVGRLRDRGYPPRRDPRDRPRHEAIRRDHARPRRALVRGRRAARSSASSARTARARRRRCGSASGSSAPTPARSAGTAGPIAELPRRTWGYLPEERGLYPRMPRPRPARLLRVALRRGATTGPAARRSPGWTASASRTTRTDGPRSCRRATSRRSSSSPRSSTDPTCCSWTSRSPGSTRSTSCSCARRSWSCATGAGRSIFSTHQMEAAEALCESVAIVDHGRVVAGGALRDLKRASGRRTIRLAARRRRGAAVARRAARRGRVAAAAAGGASSSCCPAPTRRPILAAVLARGASVTRFEVVGAEPRGAVHRARRPPGRRRRRRSRPMPRRRRCTAGGAA